MFQIFLPLVLLSVVLISTIFFNNSKAAMTLNIANYNEFLDFANALNDSADPNHDDYRTADVNLTGDIDIPMSIFEWTPIGILFKSSSRENSAKYYDYNFNGNNHTISFQGGNFTESVFDPPHILSTNAAVSISSIGLFAQIGSSDSVLNSVMDFKLNIPTTTLDAVYSRGGSTILYKFHFNFLCQYMYRVDISNIEVSIDADLKLDYTGLSDIKDRRIGIINTFEYSYASNITFKGIGLKYEELGMSRVAHVTLLSCAQNTSEYNNITFDVDELYVGDQRQAVVAPFVSNAAGFITCSSIINNTKIHIAHDNPSYANNCDRVSGLFGVLSGKGFFENIENNGEIYVDDYKSMNILIGGIVASVVRQGQIELKNIKNNGNISINFNYFYKPNLTPGVSDTIVAGVIASATAPTTNYLASSLLLSNIYNYGNISVNATFDNGSDPLDANGNLTLESGSKVSMMGIYASGILGTTIGNTGSKIEHLYNYGDVDLNYEYSSLGNLKAACSAGVIIQAGFICPNINMENIYNFGNITTTSNAPHNIFSTGITTTVSQNSNILAVFPSGTKYSMSIFEHVFNLGDVSAKRTVPPPSSFSTIATGLMRIQPFHTKIINSGNTGRIEGETGASGLIFDHSVPINMSDSTVPSDDKHPLIENTYNQGDIYLKPSTDYAGVTFRMAGISANAYSVCVNNSYNRGNLYFQPSVNQSTSTLYTGGIVAFSQIYAPATEGYNVINNSYNRGSIYIDNKGTLSNMYIGGIAGRFWNYTSVKNVYNAGNIYVSMSATGTTAIGGIIGYVQTTNLSGSTALLGTLDMSNALSLGGDINSSNSSGSSSYYVNRVLGFVFAGANVGTNNFSGLRGLVSVNNNGTPFSTGGALDDTIPLGADIPLSNKQLESFYTGVGFDGSGNNWETDNIEDNMADYRFPYLKNLDELIETVSNSGIYVGKYQVNTLSAPSIEEYEIIYMPNNGSGTMANTLATKDAIVTLSSFNFTYNGRNFLHWSTSPTDSSTGTTFNDMEVFTYTYSNNLTLYAIWEFLTYTIYYENNLGSGTMASTPAKDLTNVTLRACTFTKDGYTFDYWNTAYDGSGNSFADKYVFKPYTLMQDLTLYAIWKTKPAVVNPVNPTKTYKIIFNGNGAKGTMKALSVKAGSKLTLPKNKFTMSGQRFVSWNTKKDGTGTSYSNMYTFSSYNVNKNLILYAIFKKIGSADKIITLKPDNSTGVFTTAAFTKPKNLVFMLTMFTLLVLGIATIISLKREKIEEIQKNIEYIDGEFFTYY